MKKILSLLLVLSVVILTTLSFAEPSNWAKQSVDEAQKMGLIPKSIQNNYKQNITREEFSEMVVLLYEALSGEKSKPISSTPFKDSQNLSVIIANNLGIVSGKGEGLFAPKENISRQEIAVMFDRTLKALKIDPNVTKEYVYFSDEGQIAGWAKDSVQLLNKLNILGGVGEGRVHPLGSATREQAIALTIRTYNQFESIKQKNMEVHFIDVGQGDAILVITPNNHVLLVDAGEVTAGEKLVLYLKKAGITKIHKFVATHPHSDHIGGAQHIFNNFDVEKVYDSGFVHTTATYEAFLDTILEKDIQYEIAKRGNNIDLDNNVIIDIMHPVEPMKNSNNSSIVLRLTYNNFSVILTGDAETEAEKDLLNSGRTLKSTVLKVGHHGSNTSTSQEFLNAVNPEVAVIQVGKGNKYGHPSDEIIKRLTNNNVKIYRNDINGDIVITTNGQTYNIRDTALVSHNQNNQVNNSNISHKVNINTAPTEDLQLIIHIDTERAQQIINLRPFKSIKELTKVKGIGEIRLKEIIDQGVACVE